MLDTIESKLKSLETQIRNIETKYLNSKLKQKRKKNNVSKERCKNINKWSNNYKNENHHIVDIICSKNIKKIDKNKCEIGSSNIINKKDFSKMQKQLESAQKMVITKYNNPTKPTAGKGTGCGHPPRKTLPPLWMYSKAKKCTISQAPPRNIGFRHKPVCNKPKIPSCLKY